MSFEHMKARFPWIGEIVSAVTGFLGGEAIVETGKAIFKNYVRTELPTYQRNMAIEAVVARLMMDMPEGDRQVISNWILNSHEDFVQDAYNSIFEIATCASSGIPGDFHDYGLRILMYLASLPNDAERNSEAAAMRIMKKPGEEYAGFLRRVGNRVLVQLHPHVQAGLAHAQVFANQTHRWDPNHPNNQRWTLARIINPSRW